MTTVGEVLDQYKRSEVLIDIEFHHLLSKYDLCGVIIPHLHLNSYSALSRSLSALLVIEMDELESWLSELVKLGRV